METTTRVEWARDIFESEAEFLSAQFEENTDGLELRYDENGKPYLDEGECQGPFPEDY